MSILIIKLKAFFNYPVTTQAIFYNTYKNKVSYQKPGGNLKPRLNQHNLVGIL